MTRDAESSAFFIALVAVDVLVGLADAISGPYTVLFLVDQAGLSPLSLSAVLTVRALGAIAFATAFGAWIDRRTSVRPLLLALAASAVGYALLAFTTKFVILLLIAAGPIALGAAAFSQSIALAKRQFEHESLYTTNRAIGVLRASWSLAWAIGPAIGALVVGPFGFRGVFLTSGAAGAIAFFTLAFLRARPGYVRGSEARPSSQTREWRSGDRARIRGARPLSPALFMGSIPLPIVLTTTLGGTETDVGLAISLCAALEIVVRWARSSGGRSSAANTRRSSWASPPLRPISSRSRWRAVGRRVLWAQILRAVGIALVSYLGISFLQSLMPHRAGAAAALFFNSGQVGSVAAALGAGALGQAFGWTSVFVACAALCVAGLVLVRLR